MRKFLLLFSFLIGFVFVYSVVLSSLVIKKPSLQVNSTKQPSSLSLIGDVDIIRYDMHVVSLYENSASKDSPLFHFPSCPSAPHTLTLHVFHNSANTVDCITKRFSKCERTSLNFYDSSVLSVNSASTHYSAASANKKLKLLEFFQNKVQRFMYLDVDTFLVHGFDGLVHMWKKFSLFEKDEFIGMGKELSNMYKYESYNSGVFLVDVQKSLNYPWRETLQVSIKDAGITDLADQDVFNALDRRTNGTWIHSIDCGLNYQYAGWERCQTNCVRIVHFNALTRIIHSPNADRMFRSVTNSTMLPGCEGSIIPRESLFGWVGKPVTC